MAGPPQRCRVSAGEFAIDTRAGRTARVSLYTPAAPGSYRLLVFSHGMKCAPDGYDALLRAWAEAGYVIAAPWHPDSDLQPPDPPREELWQTRQADVLAIAALPAPMLARLPDGVAVSRTPWVVAGHSYGAFVAQAVCGARCEFGNLEPPQPGPDALIAISPPGAVPGFIPDDAWLGVKTPQLVLTGTADVLPGFIDDWKAHTTAHHQAFGPDQWLWVGVGVDHFFGGSMGQPESDAEPQTAGFDSAAATTVAFLHSYSPPAENARQTLEPYANAIATLSHKQ